MFRDKKFFEQKAADQVFGTGSNLFYLKQNFLNPSVYKKKLKSRFVKKRSKRSSDHRLIEIGFIHFSFKRQCEESSKRGTRGPVL